MTSKEYNQCRYCNHYRAYDFHGFPGQKIYACENDFTDKKICIFEYNEIPIELRGNT